MKGRSMQPRHGVIILLLLALLIVVWWKYRPRSESGPVSIQGLTTEQQRRLVDEVLALEQREAKAAGDFAAPELLAERCGEVIERWWNQLNASPDALEAVADLDLPSISVPNQWTTESIPHGIQLLSPVGEPVRWEETTWKRNLGQWVQAGWRLVQSEFRHIRFEVDAEGGPKRSEYWVSLHLFQPEENRRAALTGNVWVTWEAGAGQGRPRLQSVDASGVGLQLRSGDPWFAPRLNETLHPPPNSFFIDPLILHDLDGDGLSEIILAARNLLFRRQGDGSYVRETFSLSAPELIFTGMLADFDGDRVVDYLCATFEGLTLIPGAREGRRFDGPGHSVWTVSPRLEYAQALTAGDIDSDGDLDLFLGQYKTPYERGQMPTPYYDARDGRPDFLLLNDGSGNFVDATVENGLAPNRMRRTYGASFVDLDGDHDLDLLVTCDFAGVDLYANDGNGRFRETTSDWVSERHGFGMAHAIADLDRDGSTDFLVTGMQCPTALRLHALGLSRPGFSEYLDMIPAMTFGNRLFLGAAGNRYVTGALSQSIAKSGWTWGVSAADFDNDGFLDVYAANGHETRQSVRDFETQFWVHDIYVGNSDDDLVKMAYFGSKMQQTIGQGDSYGGYDRNRLFLNQNGERFVELGHLLGVALPQDSRNVVTDDLDGDGRVDLLVTTFEVWPVEQQTLRIFQNVGPSLGNWIGVRLPDGGGELSPVGAQVTVRTASWTTPRQMVTGTSFRSQHANTAHFGLGDLPEVEAIVVRWMDGTEMEILDPPVNTYHLMWAEGG